MRRTVRYLLRAALPAIVLAMAACGENPESTEKARGVLAGQNVVLALSVIFLVVAVGLAFAAVALDRTLRSRRSLEDAPAEPEEEEEEVETVAGIGVGRAPVPRWLYGFYVVIPVFSLLYVLNAVALAPARPAAPTPTPRPTGPQTEVTVVAKGIRFDVTELIFPAETEVTVTFDNQDAGIPHTFTVWQNEAAASAGDEAGKIADTGTFNGVAERDLRFTTPGVGTYYFNCIVHPAMKGDVQVVGGSGE